MDSVQLFVTCLVDGFKPSVGRGAVRLVERAGWSVEFPADQTCCGQPAFNVGLMDDARRIARQTVTALDRTAGPIVVPSGSCADMLKHHVPDILHDDEGAAAAERVGERVRELTQFLVDDAGVEDVGASCDGCTAVYHASCHALRNLGIRRQPEMLMDSVAGLTRVDPDEPEQCCGFGGLFSVEMPDISARILELKLDDLERSGANIVVGVDLSCLMHIEGGLRRRGSAMSVNHIAEILTGET